jgi:protein-S-isoprenylcysteine O-methyltransferase Ste14
VTLLLPQSVLHWMLVGFSAATVMFFAGVLTLYFERTERPAWVLLIHYTSVALAAAQFGTVLFLPRRADGFVVAAIGLYTAAIVLFLSSIEAAKRTRLQRSFIDHPLPDRLITDGPYAWIRHPFCTGYLLAVLAGPIAIAHPLAIVCAVPMMVIAVSAALREESVWLSSPARSEEYRAYRKKTGMFIPFV